MSTRQVEEREGRWLDRLDDAAPAAIDAGVDGEEPELEDWEQEPPLPPLRVGLVVGCTTIGAAVMAGSVFEGIAPRVYAAAAGLAGVAVAAQASRRKNPVVANLTIVLGLTAAGVVLVLPTGIDNLTRLLPILSEAKAAAKVLRPPAEFLPGWRLLIGWIMACVGFAAGWVGIEFRRPALGLLTPLPVIALGAISVPEEAKLPAGIIAVLLFIVGLTLLSSTREASDDDEAPGPAYELRRALKLLPVLAVVVVALVGLAKSKLLFPDPVFDPAKTAQRPHAVPLSKVKDRVLFRVTSTATGPWRIGILDTYDGREWRLPAFDESALGRVPRDGVVDPELAAGLRADFTVRGLGGSVLPGIPNTTGILASGPRLLYDPRTGNIRLAQGQIHDGLQYTVTAATLPSEDDLRGAAAAPPAAVRRFTDMPEPPPAVAALLREAPPAPAWDRLEFVRRRLLETVVASGPGTPKPVPPSRVDDMLAGSKQGSPFEIVAAQAMLARWAGVPARIGYGFDKGDPAGDIGDQHVFEVHPKHGASWLEVYFPGYKWLPLVGSPLKARTSLSTDGPTLADQTVEPSTDIAVLVYVPLRSTHSSLLYQRVQRIILLLLPIALVVLLAYLALPLLVKSVRRTRRRTLAQRLGPQAVIAQAYAEFRDLSTDLGLGAEQATPLAFRARFVDDEEHSELAWLVTRTLWGDLRHAVTADHALDAVELARSVRARMARQQPVALRVVAACSRLSLHRPYLPELRPPTRAERRKGVGHARTAA